MALAVERRQFDTQPFASNQISARPRILYLVGELHKGGLERQLYYLLGAMDRRRYRPAVAVWNYRESDLHVPLLRALGVPIYPLPTGSRLTKLEAFRRLVRKLEPEVIHSYNFYTNVIASLGALSSRAVVLGSVRNTLGWSKKTSGPLFGRLSARWPSHQIYNSFAAAEEAQKSGSYFVPRYIDVVSNGLDLVRFRPAPQPETIPTPIVAVGYLLPAKRWDRLLRATAELKRRGFSFHVRIVGGGPLRKELQQQASTLGVEGCVELLGHHGDMPVVFAASAFTVHTAADEGCPNAVMEAMASGRAVVATSAGDTPYLIDDGVTGFLVPPNSEGVLVERIAALLTNSELRARMGEAARLKAERCFGVDRLVSETLALYSKAGWNPAMDTHAIADQSPSV
jgi:glycosyltransferase involved in cell wall biosynthesis